MKKHSSRNEIEAKGFWQPQPKVIVLNQYIFKASSLSSGNTLQLHRLLWDLLCQMYNFCQITPRNWGSSYSATFTPLYKKKATQHIHFSCHSPELVFYIFCIRFQSGGELSASSHWLQFVFPDFFYYFLRSPIISRPLEPASVVWRAENNKK